MGVVVVERYEGNIYRLRSAFISKCDLMAKNIVCTFAKKIMKLTTKSICIMILASFLIHFH